MRLLVERSGACVVVQQRHGHTRSGCQSHIGRWLGRAVAEAACLDRSNQFVCRVPVSARRLRPDRGFRRHAAPFTATRPACPAAQRCKQISAAAKRSQPADCVSSRPAARAVRPIPLLLITVAKGNSQAAEALAGEWADKVRRYTTLTQQQVKPNPKRASDPEVAVAAEGERVLKLISDKDHVVVLDERGRTLTSEGMAHLLAQASEQGCSSMTFCIGGPYGHANAVRQRANDTIRLSSMVLNHQIANLVLLEQLYRGWTILRGEPYHH